MVFKPVVEHMLEVSVVQMFSLPATLIKILWLENILQLFMCILKEGEGTEAYFMIYGVLEATGLHCTPSELNMQYPLD